MKTFKEFISEALPFGAIVSTSSYGPGLYGNPTASGSKLTPSTRGVAHKTLPLGSKVKITDPKTKKSVVAPVVDRGPYHGNRQYDLTTQTTKDLGYKDYKQFGVRDLDVTPVPKENPKPKIPDLGVKVNMNIPKVTQTKKK
jgi:rare lipoprotein A